MQVWRRLSSGVLRERVGSVGSLVAVLLCSICLLLLFGVTRIRGVRKRRGLHMAVGRAVLACTCWDLHGSDLEVWWLIEGGLCLHLVGGRTGGH